MTWGRRQTRNAHRPCLRVYTRTAISRMRRSPRVQRGRAIFCSIAAGPIAGVLHARDRHIDVVTAYLLFVCLLFRARANRDRHEHRCRAAAIAGLRPAANSGGRLHINIPGYWAWDDDTGYYWVPGTWVLPPEQHCQRAIGAGTTASTPFSRRLLGTPLSYYGGVSYGYGYGGVGYEGGYWRGGAFFYNRSVNNFSNVQITNVYNKTVVVNNTTNVSYNGGTGGTTAHATPQQIAAANQQHVPPTSQQTQHMQMAAKDTALWFNNNHGHPTVAATGRQRQLSAVPALVPRIRRGYAGCRDHAARPQRRRNRDRQRAGGSRCENRSRQCHSGQSCASRRAVAGHHRARRVTRQHCDASRQSRASGRTVAGHHGLGVAGPGAAGTKTRLRQRPRRSLAIMRCPVCSSMAAVPPASRPPSAAPIQARTSKCIKAPALVLAACARRLATAAEAGAAAKARGGRQEMTGRGNSVRLISNAAVREGHWYRHGYAGRGKCREQTKRMAERGSRSCQFARSRSKKHFPDALQRAALRRRSGIVSNSGFDQVSGLQRSTISALTRRLARYGACPRPGTRNAVLHRGALKLGQPPPIGAHALFVNGQRLAGDDVILVSVR